MIDVQRLRNLNKTQSANIIELESRKIAVLVKDIKAAKDETDAIKIEEEKLDEAEKRLDEHLKKIESGYRKKRKNRWEAMAIEEPQEYETHT
jgi:ASC-1-like (ASCH) protein